MDASFKLPNQYTKVTVQATSTDKHVLVTIADAELTSHLFLPAPLARAIASAIMGAAAELKPGG